MYSEELKLLDANIAKLINNNPFDLLFSLRDCFKPRKINDYKYARVSIAGELEIHDYGCGLFVTSIFVSGQGKLHPETKKYDGVDWHLVFHVQSGDDSSWAACSLPYETKEEVMVLLERAKVVLDELQTLPKEEKLNELLRPYGLCGHAEY